MTDIQKIAMEALTEIQKGTEPNSRSIASKALQDIEARKKMKGPSFEREEVWNS